MGGLTDFCVVVSVATEHSYLHRQERRVGAFSFLTRVYKLPMLEFPSVQVISVVSFH
jgi:hypothetical protein